MRITVVGGGNVGTQFAVHSAEKGHEVIVYTSVPALFHDELEIVDEAGTVIHRGRIAGATDDPRKAFSLAQLIVMAVPATAMEAVAKDVYEHADARAILCMIPGNGGGECAFGRCIDRGNPFCAIERVPAISRLIEKGRRVQCKGYRSELHLASIPADQAPRCCELIRGIYDTPCLPIPGFLNLTMTPSNPILHTARLRTLFGNYHEGVVYPSVPLFYEQWDDASSELLMACDAEVQGICRALPQFRLDYVRSLKDYYESTTVRAMTRKISGIEAFKGLKTPTVRVPGGYIPDLHSRYFTADFSYGLKILCQLAGLSGVDAPELNASLAWYNGIAAEHSSFDYARYGIVDIDSLERFYLR